MGNFSGWQWPYAGADSLWMLQAGEWILVGRGEALAATRNAYVQRIAQTGRPLAALSKNCFEADIDLPRLAAWHPFPALPLKLARLQVAIEVEKGNFHVGSRVTYPQSIPWQSRPWDIPRGLVRQPLTSFSANQDIAPFFKSEDMLSHFSSDPLQTQFYFWSMGQMPFQSYIAWPVNDPTNMMRKLAPQILPTLNPILRALVGKDLIWNSRQSEIMWPRMQYTMPLLQPAPASNGQFLIASSFPLTKGTGPVPEELWAQFKSHSDMVYYDWEYTGPRLLELRAMTQALPILQAMHFGPMQMPPAKSPGAVEAQSRLNAEEKFLQGLTPLLGNTVTEITKSGPNELTLVRNGPLVFSSFEILLLSHWMSETPAGPMNRTLLPEARMSGPGVRAP
jgi:hypothetical protein